MSNKVHNSSQRHMDTTGKDTMDITASGAASNVQFPYRLHELLDEVDPSIISWLPESNAFKVIDKHTFTGKTLPHYFNATKYKSFQRNLNLWGFQTIQEGPNKGGCFHPLFVRGNREKVHYMARQKVKGGGNSKGGKTLMNTTSLSVHDTKSTLAPRGIDQHMQMMPSLAEIAVATHPGLMVALKEAKNADFTDDELKALPFMKKLHHILAQPELGDCIVWTPDGRCIRVIDPFKFLDKVQNKYFDLDITSFSSFLVELESYGFKKVTHLGFSECYYHDLMIRGCHHLCKYMEDTKSAKNFVSKEPSKDLEMDQAFGIPSLIPRAPMTTIVNNSEAVVMLEHLRHQQQQQQMAAFQAMGNMVVNPALATIGGLNPALVLQHSSAAATPISNYLAASNSNSHGATSIGGGAGGPTSMISTEKGTGAAGNKHHHKQRVGGPIGPTTTMEL